MKSQNRFQPSPYEECLAPTTTPSRVVDIDAGVVMVVTDLHGDWALYCRYRDMFLNLRAQGLAETWVLTGDFIHTEGPADTDHSLDIVLDLLALRDEVGPNLVVLLGNHEFPHIYPFVLSKGDYDYTPRFEHAMGPHRDAIVNFFDGLPFFVRTRAGVSLCHAGAFPEAHNPAALARLRTFSHQGLKHKVAQFLPENLEEIRVAIEKMMDEAYDGLVWKYFAVTGPGDARYYDYVISQYAMARPEFELLWSALFSRNELDYGEIAYVAHLNKLLAWLSEGYAPQNVMVTGHMRCRDGYRVVAGGRQLRLASGEHARPYESARYLLFDAGKPVAHARELLSGLGNVFEGR